MLDRLRMRKSPPKQVEVDHHTCHFCGACVGVCPANAIFLHNSYLKIDPSCTCCERCIPVCPVGALMLIDPPAGAAG